VSGHIDLSGPSGTPLVERCEPSARSISLDVRAPVSKLDGALGRPGSRPASRWRPCRAVASCVSQPRKRFTIEGRPLEPDVDVGDEQETTKEENSTNRNQPRSVQLHGGG